MQIITRFTEPPSIRAFDSADSPAPLPFVCCAVPLLCKTQEDELIYHRVRRVCSLITAKPCDCAPLMMSPSSSSRIYGFGHSCKSLIVESVAGGGRGAGEGQSVRDNPRTGATLYSSVHHSPTHSSLSA